MTTTLSPTGTATATAPLSLDAQYAAYARNRFLAMPVTGTIVWIVIGICGWLLPPSQAALAIFAGTGMIFYLAIVVGRLLGEDVLARNRRGNRFDRIFLSGVAMAALMYAIAIPFYLENESSLPLSVGILTGLMWLPFSALLGHWVGYFHGIARTVLILVAWYLWPEHRFVTIPAVVVGVYVVSIIALQRRWVALQVSAA